MEQWIEDGRATLWERWNEQNKQKSVSVSTDVAAVASATQTEARIVTCLSSALLTTSRCRTMEEEPSRGLWFRFDTDNEFARAQDLSGFFGLVKRQGVLQQDTIFPPTHGVEANPTVGAESNIESPKIHQDRPKPKADCVVDYAWYFEGCEIERVDGMEFVAGAGCVTQCMEEGVLSMVVGEVAEFACDSAFAFKDNGFQPLNVRREESEKVARKMMGDDGRVTSENNVADVSPSVEPIAAAEPATTNERAPKEEKKKKLIPPDSCCTLRMKLVRFTNAMTSHERLTKVASLRELAGAAVAQKRWEEAGRLYAEAYELHIKPIPSEPSGGQADVAAILLHNTALCLMEQSVAATENTSTQHCSREVAAKAIALCRRSIKANPVYVKARYRKVLAHIARQEYGEAQEEVDAMRGLSMDEGTIRSLCEQIAAARKEADQALSNTCKRMFQ